MRNYINANRPDLWKQDVAESVDLYNEWFIRFAPQTYRESRDRARVVVKEGFELTKDLSDIAPAAIRRAPQVLPILRMCTAPPIAKDRLVGLAYVSTSLVTSLEEGKLPKRMSTLELEDQLHRISETIELLLDRDLFPWIADAVIPDDQSRERAATVVADRLCGARANPIIRNAQEQRQLQLISQYLEERGYRKESPLQGSGPTGMPAGTYCIRLNVPVGSSRSVNIPIDVAIQPHSAAAGSMPVLIEAKSAGDFTNTNKRRKEEATKIRQLQDRYGPDTTLILFLCGYFDSGYLGYEAAEGLDWIWEHRIDDMRFLGI